jgi:hypothetical protein
MVDLTVANTILAQLGGSARLSAMIGAHTFSGGNNVLTFKFKAQSYNNSNAICIFLTDRDDYTVEFIRTRGVTIKSIKKVDGVYAEDLVRIIASETGLALHL